MAKLKRQLKSVLKKLANLAKMANLKFCKSLTKKLANLAVLAKVKKYYIKVVLKLASLANLAKAASILPFLPTLSIYTLFKELFSLVFFSRNGYI